MKNLYLAVLATVASLSVAAQALFIPQGKIEYEKKINLKKQMEAMKDDDQNDFWSSMIAKALPQTAAVYFDLYFDDTKTLYKPGKEVATQKIPDWIMGPALDNTVYNDLASKQTVAQKSVFESTFLIQDSLKKYDWKISADARTIAGFQCRKATTIIMDSVYVIAFYTDQILTSGGPESFHGLPGMILGISIPRLNTTWMATKLELIPVKPTDLVAPKKGKKITAASLNGQLKESMKDWGKNGQKNTWQVML